MQFIVEPDIFDRFPNMCLAVVVAHGIDNQADRPEIEERWQETWADAAAKAAAYGNAQSHPHVQLWRERFREQGISGKQFPSSIEALLRRALKGNAPIYINPLVDFYNTISSRHIVPAGGFDLDQIHGPLELRLSHSGDTFMALDEDLPQAVPPGEIAYADGQTILTRHFVWRQAKTGLITQSTRSVFLVSEVLGKLESGLAEKVLNDFRAGLQAYFGVTPGSFLVDEQHPTISW
jgi:DNA/RNA-binding domain of Phe-tRNA-synthetase-like protein